MTFTINNLNYATKYLLNLPRARKRVLVILVDVFLCATTSWLALYLRLGEFELFVSKLIWVFSFALLFTLPTFFFLGLYRAIFRYTSILTLMLLLRAISVYAPLFFWSSLL